MCFCDGATIKTPACTSKNSGNLELDESYTLMIHLLYSSSLTWGSIIIFGSKLFISTKEAIFFINLGGVFVTIILNRNYLDKYLLLIVVSTIKVPIDYVVFGLI
jgi:hypothetical protein